MLGKNTDNTLPTFTDEHREELREAKFLLENPSVAARFSNVLASPIEKGFELLPDNAREVIYSASEKALSSALDVAMFTLNDEVRQASNLTHKALAAVSGAAGGAFGLPALALELPISTTIMLRSIADIARSEGEDLGDMEARLACIEVFALGGTGKGDDAAESGYFAARAAMAKSVSETVKYATGNVAADVSAPPMARFIARVASRFGLVVEEKAAAQFAPILGAAGGAIINTLFIDHFQDMAKGHFVVRRLERLYGEEQVRAEYQRLPSEVVDQQDALP